MPRDSEHNKTDRELLIEMHQRSRRLETKISKVADAMGIDHGGDKPVLDGSVLRVPSVKVSLEDVITAIGEHSGAVSVWCKDEYLATVAL